MLRKNRIYVLLCLVVFLAGCKNEKQERRFVYFQNYSRTFNDMQAKHVEAADKIGIQPLENIEEIKKQKKKLKEIKSNRYYELDNLTHSHPYLVPEAVKLLDKVARTFQDSLKSKSLPKYSLIVTSVLRTQECVKRLQKQNINASANSVHMRGTTFDIAYARFKKKSSKETENDKLKSVLAEVLRDLQKSHECYVRYEYKQGCFHITAR